MPAHRGLTRHRPVPKKPAAAGPRYEKSESVLRIALAMQGSAQGLSLVDIERELGVGRRTAERVRDAVERVFPQMEPANPGELPKRWRIRTGAAAGLVGITAEELAALAAALDLMRRENLAGPLANLEKLELKVRSLLPPAAALHIEPDLQALSEAEGLALRPGPRPDIASEVVALLRHAILACRKVRLHYRARGTGTLSRQLVCPYGFLYGNRHYLVADSLNERSRGFRLFSLGNIEKAELADDPFVRRADFSLREFASRSFGVFQEEPFEVAWRFSPRAAADARQFHFHPTQALEEQPDGSLIVRFRAGGALEMCWHLFTWGGEVEVLEPERLRLMLADQATAATAVAGAGR